MIMDVMVHLDGSPEDEIRLAHAEALAARAGAHLTGLFTNALPDIALALPVEAGAAAAALLAEAEQYARGEGEATHRRLQGRFARLGVPNDVRLLQETPGMLPVVVARAALCADVLVVSRPYGPLGDAGWARLVEEALFGSGRALLLVPPGRAPQGPLRTVMVAWEDKREAARAVREAIPFMEDAGRTIVVLVDPGTRDRAEPEAEIARHLARHGTKVEAVIASRGDRTVAEELLDQARRCSADLIVMGGYGHSRLSEWVLGGVTTEMLEECPYPILLAH
jgi:nucleotide-binding universal stress UspA family protein